MHAPLAHDAAAGGQDRLLEAAVDVVHHGLRRGGRWEGLGESVEGGLEGKEGFVQCVGEGGSPALVVAVPVPRRAWPIVDRSRA